MYVIVCINDSDSSYCVLPQEYADWRTAYIASGKLKIPDDCHFEVHDKAVVEEVLAHSFLKVG